MLSLLIQPFRTKSGFNRTCFCGKRPAYHVPGTVYYYCRTHAIEARRFYQRWFAKGGRSRFMAA